MILSDTGRVFTFGCGSFGQLGHANNRGDKCLPAKIAALSHKLCIQIAAGCDHSLVLDDSGQVFSFGSNRDGQLSHGDEKDRDIPTLIQGLYIAGAVRAEASSAMVGAIAAGACHSLFLSASGDAVLACGDGSFGQLGCGDDTSQNTPTPMLLGPQLDGRRITRIAAGSNHSMLLDEAGAAYTCGAGGRGRLGHGITANELIPKRIQALEDHTIVDMSPSEMHSMVVSDTGDLFTFGCGRDGQLGHVDAVDEDVPTRVEALRLW
jgi:alpha-tubulin suppressor-like RCC1 family protein